MGYDEAGRVKSVPGFVSDLTWDALGRPDTKTNA
jgi:YD repeat-containing protein